jgi:predicted nucleic acid-binding protein
VSKVQLRRGLVETRLFLDIISGDHQATNFATELLALYSIEMSELTALAAVAGCQDPGELAIVLRILNNNRVHHITSPISQRARRLLESTPPPSPLTADDGIVAATALIHKLPVYTLDPARFAVVPRLTTIQPY